MKVHSALVAALLLTACDGTTVGGGPAVSPTATQVDPVVMNGWNSSGEYVVAALSDDGATIFADRGSVSFAFDGSGGLEMTAEGNVTTLAWNDAQGAYVSDDGTIVVTVYNDPSTPDVFVFKAKAEIPPPDGSSGTLYAVSGALTPGADLPTTGSAEYAGAMEFTDYLGNTAGGDISLTVQFDSATVGGQFSLADGLVTGPATFTFDNGAITTGAGFSNFRDTVQSSDVMVTDSGIFGEFMGDQGGEMGGLVYVNTPDAAIAGVFTATN
jgi:hypothetical protein